MARRSRPTAKGKAHGFGGDWTSTKLDVLAKYLAAYTTALKVKPTAERPFLKAYIDAFAGTGYRTARRDRDEDEDASGMLPFPDLAAADPQQLLDGSARLALKVEPRFDRYIFIERDAKRCAELEGLRAEFPDLAADIRVEQGDANAEIQKLCAKRGWGRRRAVLFLDPYGMQVEWQTIEAIANTKAIDLWLLFPLGIGVSRLLTRSGEIPKGWRTRLDKLLGTTSWYDDFYKVEHQADLFGNDEERVVKATNETIAQYFNDRLKTIFAGVAEPGVLRNSSNNPLYLLCFAAANEKGAPTALRIANSLLSTQEGELMALGSGIEWTESTWNPVTGCNKISPGCKYCYAERMAERLQAMGQPNYRNGFELTLQPKMLALPLQWKKPQTIFVNSMSDLFHEDVPLEYIQRVFDVMRRAHWHRFQVLTKRADRLAELSPEIDWPENVWMGVSVEDANYVDRIDDLRRTGAHLKFLSLEPLLGPLRKLKLKNIDWVIVGGESGHRARPMAPAWVTDIRDQCARAGVAFFFKQWGGKNKKKAGRTLDGRTYDEMPETALSVPVARAPRAGRSLPVMG